MITFCQKCNIAYNVVGHEPLTFLHGVEWKDSYPCVTNNCGGRAYIITWDELNSRPNVERIIEVDAHRYYRALLGLGLSKGAPACAADVKKLLLNKKISEVHAFDIGQPERTIIERLVFDDGTRMHFAASSRGACVYFIEEKPRSGLEAFDEQYPGGSSPSGEEGGRDHEVGGGPSSEGRHCCCHEDTEP